MSAPLEIKHFRGVAERLPDVRANWEFARYARDVDLANAEFNPMRAPKLALALDRAMKSVFREGCRVFAAPGPTGFGRPFIGETAPIYFVDANTGRLMRTTPGNDRRFERVGFEDPQTTASVFAPRFPEELSVYHVPGASGPFPIEDNFQEVERIDVGYTLCGYMPDEESGLFGLKSVEMVGRRDTPFAVLERLVQYIGLPTEPGMSHVRSVRVYCARSPIEHGGEGANPDNVVFARVAEIPYGSNDQVNFTLDMVPGAALNFLRSDPPPAGICDLVDHRNGVLSARHGRFIRFSAPGRPHAWPMEHAIMPARACLRWLGGRDYGFALTTGEPIIIAVETDDPLHRRVRPIEADLPIKGARTAVMHSGAAVYRSRDGVVLLMPNGQYRILTADRFTPQQWRAQTISRDHVGVVHEGYYYSFGSVGSFRLRLPEAAYGDYDPEFVWLSIGKVSDAFVDEGRLFFVGEVGAEHGLFEWGASEQTLAASWISREWRLPSRIGLSYVTAEADGPVALEVMDRGKIIKRADVMGDAPQRFARFTVADRLSVAVHGQHKVGTVRISRGLNAGA